MGALIQFRGTPILPGTAIGPALAADTPLSFWGGFDPDTGLIIDQRHPLAGASACGSVLLIPSGRGSCSGSGVLLEAIHNGTAPVAIVISTVDPIIALGAILGDELYQAHPAIILLAENDRRSIATGDRVEIDVQGWLTVTKSPAPAG
jgi:predicted aconitase with swiveling domain